MPVTEYPYYGSLQAPDGSDLRITNGDGTAAPVHGTWLAQVVDGHDGEGRPQIVRMTLKLADGRVYSEAIDPATSKPYAGSMAFRDTDRNVTLYDKLTVDQIAEGEQLLGAALGSYMSPPAPVVAEQPGAKKLAARTPEALAPVKAPLAPVKTAADKMIPPEKIDPKPSELQAKAVPVSATPTLNQGMPAHGYRGSLKGIAYNESEQKILADAARHPRDKKKVQAAQLILEERDVDTGKKNHHAETPDLDGIAGTMTKKGLKEALAQIHQQNQLAKKVTPSPKANS